MSKADFEAKQTFFVAGLALSFGTLVSLVRIQSVTEAFTRNLLFPARHLLSTAVSVSSMVETSNHIEPSSLSQQLVVFGLPSPTSIDILYPSSQSSSLITTSPAYDSTPPPGPGGLPPAYIGTICGGGVLIVVLLFCYWTCQRRAAKKSTYKGTKIDSDKRHDAERREAAAGPAERHDAGLIVYQQGSSAATNHKNHLVDGDDLKGVYQPMVQYANRPPNLSCLESIRACADILDIPEVRMSQALVEVEMIADSRADDPDAKQLMSGFSDEDMRSHILAIVMYTFDFSKLIEGHRKEDNFYYNLNQVLRKRNSRNLDGCTPFLYYLMRGLEKLPSYPTDKVLWRGVDAAGREKLMKSYIVGRKIYWSGFSSASLEQGVAREFAGQGGLLLQVQLVANSLARDIRAFSAFPCEDEILLLPNFCAKVASPIKSVEGHAGKGTWDVLELLEEVKSSLPAHRS